MADTKITALTALTAADPSTDVLPIVDTSDTTMAASGTTKKISINNILGASGTATLASATISGNLTVSTSINANGGALALYMNGALLAGTSSGFHNFFSTTNGTRFYNNTGLNELYSFSNAGVFSWFDGAGGTRMTLNANGLGVGVVPSAGKGALQLSSGINFPATQVASSDANTLDDYEEGTWSPTIVAASGTPTTVTVNSATYTKIGRLVVCSFDFSIVNIGTASSSLQFSLPFASATSASFCGAFREKATTGSMGQVFYNSATDASCLLYNNNTVWVNGYRISGNYTYFAA